MTLRFKRALSVFLSATLALQFVLPSAALAMQHEVEVDNHTTGTGQTSQVSGIRIDGVDKPEVGARLDNKAIVTTAEDNSWEIPVLWVRDDMQLDEDEADDGYSYLPALAYFVPEEYALDDDVYTVALSDSLTTLFGTEEVISVYDASKEVTYILPASLKHFFSSSQVEGMGKAATAATAATATKTVKYTKPAKTTPQKPGGQSKPGTRTSLVDIYCASTARKALSDKELEWLIDLIIERLQPQAVDVLLKSFPAFRNGAKKGEIGKEIGLYIYYKKGDNDGDPFHKTLDNSLAYVAGYAKKKKGKVKYQYLLAVDVNSLLVKDAKGNPIVDKSTGKYKLVRGGTPIINLQNTLVHETFHALMDDFNRTGMAGATNLSDVLTGDDNKFASTKLANRYNTIKFPSWFMEGTASAVENVYQYRYDTFQILRRAKGENGFGTGALNKSFTARDLLNNYLVAKYMSGGDVDFDIRASDAATDSKGNPIDSTASQYVTGYLATLYLCNLASIASNGKSAVQTKNGVTTVDADTLCEGLNTILYNLHNGRTMDYLINKLSPKDANGKPVYKDTDDFASKFIRGTVENEYYVGDKNSMDFVLSFLNYMLYLDNKLPANRHPNGSILVPFDKYYETVLNANKKLNMDYLRIIKSNTAAESTVKPTVAKIGAGKSDPDVRQAQSDENPATELPVAAKTEEPVATNDEATNATEPAAAESAATEPAAAPAATEPVPEPAAEPSAAEPVPDPLATTECEPASEAANTAAPAAEPAAEPSTEPESAPETRAETMPQAFEEPAAE
ncbi:MAG: hypothetical protein IKG22_12235 [Atopobiaceae bacterium]|nr:hypothetical protein [Atopobiaceae bacterium]